jgi:hypothetical protein
MVREMRKANFRGACSKLPFCEIKLALPCVRVGVHVCLSEHRHGRQQEQGQVGAGRSTGCGEREMNGPPRLHLTTSV